MSIEVVETALNILDMRTRMPFKYGIATLTALPHLLVSLRVRIDGEEATGMAADGLPPKWFTKAADQPFDREIEAMLAVAQAACQAARTAPPQSSVFDLWRVVYERQEAWAADQSADYPPLLWAFGVTLVERALIEAFCRAKRATFAEAVRGNLLGIRLGEVYPELGDAAPADYLPRQALRQVRVRHTVGLADPLTEGELTDDERLADGLPQTLDQCIRDYGLSFFKIKLQGRLTADLERLRQVAAVIRKHAAADFRFSLDGNEQYGEIAAFRELWDAARGDAAMAPFLEHLLFVEQPLHRQVALADPVGAQLAGWKARPPMIIDESDGELRSLARALELGYCGASHKNCKGVFKGIANRCLIEARQRQRPGHILVMSAEDLANVGPVALVQDLAVLATLGIADAERNGHHYFRGLSMFPQDIQRQALACHPDLYRAHAGGCPTLAIDDGMLSIGSVIDAPFGRQVEFDPARFTPVDEWSPERLGEG